MVNIREKDRPKKAANTKKRKTKGKPSLYLALLLVVIFIMAIVYSPKRGMQQMRNKRIQPEKTTSAEPQFVRQGELTFVKANGTVLTKIDIEVADTDAKREQGLMYRRQMDLNRGMLFIFDDVDLRSFWMKNTYLPLDILYVNAEKKIVKICENMATLNEQPIPSDFPAKYFATQLSISRLTGILKSIAITRRFHPARI